MCWVPNRRLWRKVYRGKTYMISCRQLRELGYDQGPNALLIDDTKTGSYVAANSWWNKKEHELEAQRRATERPPTALEQLALSYVPLARPDLPTTIEEHRQADNVLHELYPESQDGGPPRQLRAVLLSLLADVLFKGQPLPEQLVQALPPARASQVSEAVKTLKGEPTVLPEQTVAAHAERWIKLKEDQVVVGQLALGRFESLRMFVGYFRDFVGATSPAESMDAAKLQGFYSWCLDKVRQRQQDPAGKAGWSSMYAKKVFEAARVFVKYLWESGLIELPRNVNSRDFRFNVGVKAIVTWTAEEFQRVLARATGQLQLHLLLMANCGMVQQDISDLLDTEVVWNADGTAERIIRKRSKTRSHGNVPVVSYQLWPLTGALLKKWRSGQAQVLRTKSGGPWKRSELVNGKPVRCDNLVTSYTRQQPRLGGFDKPLKGIRKLGATILESHETHHRFTKLYLGHAPDSIKDRHYADVPKDEFDKALTWLGQQLGQVGAGEVGPTDVARGPGSDL
jgi:integrase